MPDSNRLQEATKRANAVICRELFDQWPSLHGHPWREDELELFQKISMRWMDVALSISIPAEPSRSPMQRTGMRRRVMTVISGLGTVFDLGCAGDQAGLQREMRRLEMNVRKAVQAIEDEKSGLEEISDILRGASGDWLTTQQAAQLLGLEPNTIVQHIHAGQIKAERAGRVFLIPILEVKRYGDMRRNREGRRGKFDVRPVDDQ